MSSRTRSTKLLPDLAAFCHAAAFPVPAGAEPSVLAGRFAAAIGQLRITAEPLWCERVPGAVAEIRRATEMARPIPAGGAALRGVLLQRDTGADLVLVVRRSALDPARLAALGAAVLDGADLPVSADPVPETTAVGSAADDPDASGPDASASDDDSWTVDPGATGTAGYTFALPTGADQASLISALGLVLARYRAVSEARIGTIVGNRLIVVTVPVAGSARDVAAGWPTSGPGWLADGQPADPAVLDAAVGVVVGVPERSVPYLAPPWPLSIAVYGDRGVATYRRAAWPTRVCEQFTRHVAAVLAQIVADPDRRLDSCELFDAVERNAIVDLGTTPPLTPRPDRTIHEVIAAQARATPDARAVSYQDERLSYAALDERAERISDALRGHGVGAGSRVGVCLERSTDLIAVLLGVLKTGAAYVPIDPAYPADRAAFTSQDAGLALMVGGSGVSVAELLAGSAAAVALSGSVAGPDDPAYIIYTSGSTGRPKGVLVPHRNVLALIDGVREDFGLGPSDVWTMFHSSAFDFSVWEIWGALLTGGHLIVVGSLVVRSPEEFHELLYAEGVTVLSQTPSAFGQLIEADRRSPRRLPVRLVIFGGEPLDAGMLIGWFDRYPETVCRLVNMFGITETTVHVTAQTMDRAAALSGSRSVGPAIPGWGIYILDPSGRLLPPELAGEIYVAGAGVADGYLNRPELTAERFLPDPFRGGRMYRSGDRGRLRGDGRVEHLGRLDSQVKIRGYRIELDEIRQVLLEDPAVVSVAVVADTSGAAADARLDAYVVARDGGDGAAIRKRAARILPAYMVPASVTVLAALPLTANGKLDTARLPAPVRRPEAAPVADDPAGDGLFERIRTTWEDVLGDSVGPDDNFFDLGGNSLLAIRLLAELRERGVGGFAPRHLYVYPTVRGLADAIRTEQG